MKRDGLSYKPFSNGPLKAKVEQYYESGQLNALYTVIDAKWEGLVQFWYENGQLRAEETYVDGKIEGLGKWWHENSQHEQEVTYVNGKGKGIQHQWNENGGPNEFCLKAGELTGMSYCTEGKQP